MLAQGIINEAMDDSWDDEDEDEEPVGWLRRGRAALAMPVASPSALLG